MAKESGDSKTIVLFFPELVSKSPPERENGGQIGEIRVYVLWSFRIRGDITGWPKPPFSLAFPYSAILFHIVGDLPSKRVCEHLILRR
jgi:hypothetical protein